MEAGNILGLIEISDLPHHDCTVIVYAVQRIAVAVMMSFSVVVVLITCSLCPKVLTAVKPPLSSHLEPLSALEHSSVLVFICEDVAKYLDLYV